MFRLKAILVNKKIFNGSLKKSNGCLLLHWLIMLTFTCNLHAISKLLLYTNYEYIVLPYALKWLLDKEAHVIDFVMITDKFAVNFFNGLTMLFCV